VPAGSAVLGQYWSDYATAPAKPYSDRVYDGVGVFGHLSDLAGDELVWARLLPVVQRAATTTGPTDVTPFDLLIQGNDDGYLSSWGSSYFLTSGKRPGR
jgi:hypothetical protein